MHSHRRHRGKVLFEVLCASLLAASLVGAWDETRASGLLGSAAVVALFALYWSFGLIGRGATEAVAAAAEQPFAPATAPVTAPVQLAPIATPPAEQVEAFAAEPHVEPRPEAAEAKLAKPRARKRKAKPVVDLVVEQPEPVAMAEPAPVAAAGSIETSAPVEAPIEETVPAGPSREHLFEPQAFARPIRPAFGRKSPDSPPLPAA